MTDPKVHDIIAEAVVGWVDGQDQDTLANAVVGALATGGFAIVQVDAEVLRRVLAEMSQARESKR